MNEYNVHKDSRYATLIPGDHPQYTVGRKLGMTQDPCTYDDQKRNVCCYRKSNPRLAMCNPSLYRLKYHVLVIVAVIIIIIVVVVVVVVVTVMLAFSAYVAGF
jgi:hypothetical protein